MTSTSPKRILHVVGAMNPGGVETWLMQLLRHVDRNRYRMDFLVHSMETSFYDNEIRSLGSEVISCPHHRQPLVYAHHVANILRRHGPYDCVHSHVHLFSGWVLRLAERAGVRLRISHSHSDTSRKYQGPLKRLYATWMRRWIRRHATAGLACSRAAAAALYGSRWESDPRWQVVSYARDLSPFRESADRASVRAELGIPVDAFVVGHVGSFTRPKNHPFWLEIATEVARRDADAWFLLVGDGKLRQEAERRVRQSSLARRVVFAGTRTDVPRLMLGATDCFLFPSLWEGLGLALVEAQAAGLPCVVADVVPQEADVVRPLLRRLSLLSPIDQWANAVLEFRNVAKPVDRVSALALVEQSVFNIENGLKQMESIYRVQ